MSRFFVVLVTFIAIEQNLSVVASIISVQSQPQLSPYIHHGGYGKKYSGAELTSIAHSSAHQAKSALRQQQTAGIQAALVSQSGYTRAAVEAANTAKVALVAKHAIVANLEKHIEDAEHQLRAEELQYQQAVQAASVAQAAVHQSQKQLAAASAAIASVQQAVLHSEQAAAAASQAAATQHHMIFEAQNKLRSLHAKLQQALHGLEETGIAAQRANAAAQVAQTNSAASAQLALVHSANEQVDEHDEYHHHQ